MHAVQCDMTTPICSHCKRRREECDYRDGSGSQIDYIEYVDCTLTTPVPSVFGEHVWFLESSS